MSQTALIVLSWAEVALSN